MYPSSNIEHRNPEIRRMSPAGVAAFMILFVLLFILTTAGRVEAQALHPDVMLTHPTSHTMNRLDVLRSSRPVVALYNGAESATQISQSSGQTVRNAVYNWELLLLGLNIPYVPVHERDLAGGISRNIRVLILPSADVLSEKQQSQVLRYVERGGGVIASGQVGAYDDRGRPRGDVFFRQLYGAELVSTLPDQPSGILQSLGGGHPLTDGLPPGFRLNLSPQLPMSAARATSGMGVGRPYTYSNPGGIDPFEDVTMVVYNRLDRGRSVWLRFNPQDVSREPVQQEVYQSFIINSLAYAANVTSVSIRPWPDRFLSATVLAALPEGGLTDNLASYANRALDALGSVGAAGTFFMTSQDAAGMPQVLRRIAQVGEIAISSDTYDILKKQPLEVQQRRLQTALSEVAGFTSSSIVGLYPPNGFYDVATIRAAYTAGLKYMLQPAVGESAYPRPLRWYGDADYREPLILAANDNTAVAGSTPPRSDRGQIVALPMTGKDDYTTLQRAGEPAEQVRAYQEDFMRVHHGRGLYVLPYHLSMQARTQDRAAVLAQVAEIASRQGSWLTTFSDVVNWWEDYNRVSIQIVEMSGQSVTIDLINASTTSVRRVSFDMRLTERARAANATGNLNVLLSSDGETVTATVPVVRPGSNRYSISVDTR